MQAWPRNSISLLEPYRLATVHRDHIICNAPPVQLVGPSARNFRLILSLTNRQLLSAIIPQA